MRTVTVPAWRPERSTGATRRPWRRRTWKCLAPTVTVARIRRRSRWSTTRRRLAQRCDRAPAPRPPPPATRAAGRRAAGTARPGGGRRGAGPSGVAAQRWLGGDLVGLLLSLADRREVARPILRERARVDAGHELLSAHALSDPRRLGRPVVRQRVERERPRDRVVAADDEMVGGVVRADILERGIADPAVAGAQRRGARPGVGVRCDDLVAVREVDRVVDARVRLGPGVERPDEVRVVALLPVG